MTNYLPPASSLQPRAAHGRETAIEMLRELYSVRNLTVAGKRRSLSGQVATFLLLTISGALVFALMLGNLGHTSMTATTIQNTADSASLTLASQLATKAEGMREANDGKISRTIRGQIWGIILAVVLAIVAIVLYLTGIGAAAGAALTALIPSVVAGSAAAAAIVSAVTAIMSFLASLLGSMTAAIGLIGGLVGGLIGGAIDTGTVQGALLGGLQGAAIGAVIGAGVNTVGSMFATTPTTAGGTATAGPGGLEATAGAEGASVGGTFSPLPIDATAGTPMSYNVAPMSQEAALGAGETVWIPEGSQLTLSSGSLNFNGAGTFVAAGATQVTQPIAMTSVNEMTPFSKVTLAAGESIPIYPGAPMSTAVGEPFTAANLGLGAAGEAGSGGMAPAVEPIPSMVGQVGGGALASGARLGSAYISQTMRQDAVIRAIRGLAVLGEKGQIRESIIFQALSETIDDANKTSGLGNPGGGCYFPEAYLVEDEHVSGDRYDTDGDGDIKESIPCFQYWWDRRIDSLKNATDQHGNNLADTFRTTVQGFMGETLNKFEGDLQEVLSVVSTKEINPTDGDGELAQLLRVLEEGYQIDAVDFWNPGPSAAKLHDFGFDKPAGEEIDCEENPNLCVDAQTIRDAGYDDVDITVGDVRGWIEGVIQGFQDPDADGQSLTNQDINQLVATRDSWIEEWNPTTSAPDEEGDVDGALYQELVQIAQRIRDWNAKLTVLKTNPNRRPDHPLHGCELDFAQLPQVVIVNAPCYNDGTQAELTAKVGEQFATTDGELDDEFEPVQQRLGEVAGIIETFLPDIAAFYNTMRNARGFEDAASDWGGVDPSTTYAWQDSRGQHHVTVQVSNFKIPRLKPKKSWPDTIVKVKNYASDGTNTWVRITRQDEVKGLGGTAGRPMWTWNSTDNGPGSDGMRWRTITKLSRARYDIRPAVTPNNRVSLAEPRPGD